MVEVARAVVDSPRVLLLDEPTSGLEESEADNLGGVMQRLRDEEGCAVVLVEHDVGFVMRQCDRIAVLAEGRVITSGPIPTMLASEHPWVKSYFHGKRSRVDGARAA